MTAFSTILPALYHRPVFRKRDCPVFQQFLPAGGNKILYFCKSIYGFIEIRFLYTEGIRYNFFAFMESL